MSFYRDFNDKIAIEAWNSERRQPYETIGVKQLSPTVVIQMACVHAVTMSATPVSRLVCALSFC